jgi:predicted peroxiredoxin
MANKFGVNLTCAKDNPDKATVAFVIANAAAGSGKEALVFLSIEGVRLAQRGYADDIREEGFAPLKELMESFAKAAGRSWSARRASRSASSTRTAWWRVPALPAAPSSSSFSPTAAPA